VEEALAVAFGARHALVPGALEADTLAAARARLDRHVVPS